MRICVSALYVTAPISTLIVWKKEFTGLFSICAPLSDTMYLFYKTWKYDMNIRHVMDILIQNKFAPENLTLWIIPSKTLYSVYIFNTGWPQWNWYINSDTVEASLYSQSPGAKMNSGPLIGNSNPPSSHSLGVVYVLCCLQVPIKNSTHSRLHMAA